MDHKTQVTYGTYNWMELDDLKYFQTSSGQVTYLVKLDILVIS